MKNDISSMERKFVPVPSGVEKMGYEKSAKVMQGSSKLKRPVSGIVNFNRAMRDAIWLIFGALFSYERRGTKLRAAAGCGTSSTHLDSLPRSFVRSFARSFARSLPLSVRQFLKLSLSGERFLLFARTRGDEEEGTAAAAATTTAK